MRIQIIDRVCWVPICAVLRSLQQLKVRQKALMLVGGYETMSMRRSRD